MEQFNKSVNILNIPLFHGTITDAVETVILHCQSDIKKNLLVSATGAHGMIIAKNDRSFFDILRSFYINLPDGMPGVWIGRLKGAHAMSRCYGPDFFKELVVKSSRMNIRHFFCGGREGIAEQLKNICNTAFNNKNIVGYYTPPFRTLLEEELINLAEEINKLRTDIVWVGLSTPKQEILAHRLATYTKVHFIITVGAAFDFHTNNVKQAPRIMQKLSLEWFFRLMIEPKRLYKRYLEIVPKFIYYNFIEFVKYIFQFKSGERANE